MHDLPEDRTLFEAIPDPAYLLDRHGTILDMNAAARAEAVPGGENLIGRPVQHSRLKALAGELPAALERAIAQRATLTIEYSTAADGPETHQEVRLTALPAQQVLVLIRDITERKLTENALRESDAQFRVLANNITDAF